MDCYTKSIVTYNDVLNYWFSSKNEGFQKFWFSSKNNKTLASEIKNKFYNILKIAEERKLTSWTKDNNKYSHLALIILLDQFSRHIYRFSEKCVFDSFIDGLEDCNCKNNKHKIRLNDMIALQLTYDIINYNDFFEFPINHIVFALMPLRHSQNSYDLFLLHSVIHRYDINVLNKNEKKVNTDSIILWNKFKKNSNYIIKGEVNVINEKSIGSDEKLIEGKDKEILDDNSTHLTKFTSGQNINDNIKKSSLYLSLMDFIQTKIRSTKIFISLSGGIDSMVISYLLHAINCFNKNANNVAKIQVIALHIDYANRPESGLEATYVEEWCAGLNIIFHKKVINNYTRGIDSRDVYETKSRQIRYDFYKSVIDIYTNAECNAGGGSTERFGIIIGHHSDDIIENVFTNIIKGRKLLDLAVMQSSNIINEVLLFRPLIDFRKKDIYDFAHLYGIPYFKDTTPLWSNRGKLRNELFPLIESMYGSDMFKNHLLTLNNESKTWNGIIHKNIMTKILDGISFYSNKNVIVISVDEGGKESSLLMEENIWNKIFIYIFHTVGQTMITNKTLRLFMETLCECNRLKKDKCVKLKKNYIAAINHMNNCSKIVIVNSDYIVDKSNWIYTIEKSNNFSTIEKYKLFSYKINYMRRDKNFTQLITKKPKTIKIEKENQLLRYAPYWLYHDQNGVKEENVIVNIFI